MLACLHQPLALLLLSFGETMNKVPLCQHQGFLCGGAYCRGAALEDKIWVWVYCWDDLKTHRCQKGAVFVTPYCPPCCWLLSHHHFLLPSSLQHRLAAWGSTAQPHRCGAHHSTGADPHLSHSLWKQKLCRLPVASVCNCMGTAGLAGRNLTSNGKVVEGQDFLCLKLNRFQFLMASLVLFCGSQRWGELPQSAPVELSQSVWLKGKQTNQSASP